MKLRYGALAFLIGLFLCLILGFISIRPSQASASFVVNSFLDEPDANQGDSICASTPSGQCTLRAAIMEANLLLGAETIVLPAGTYTLTITDTSGSEDSVGDLDICSDLTISGADSSTTIINANGIGRVFDVACGVNRNVTISALTIRGGQNPVMSFGEGGGGLRMSTTGALTLTNVIITDNMAWDGGGIFNSNYGKLNIINSTVFSNTSPNGSGGIFNHGVMEILSSTISNNNGGGVLNYGGVITATHSGFIANSGGYGAGIANAGHATIINSTISGNTSHGPYGPPGGGIYNSTGVITITNSTISNNSASGSGGGLYNIRVYFGLNGVYLYNVTVANNITDIDGDDFGDGGGIANVGGWVLSKNTLFGGNSDMGGQAPDFSGTLISQGYNLIQSTTGYTVTGILSGNLIGVNPNFGPLQNNGGPTLTHALLFGSPAIDAGDPTGCKDNLGSFLLTDQRGFSRPIDGDQNGSSICDIGAYEAALSISLPSLYLPLVLR
jgi:CSLREA domain-containing protein